MARIKIELPENYVFSTTIKVRVSDINYGGHLGNDALLSILHDARLQYLQSLGYTELAFGSSSLIMADVAIEYKGEGFLGDTLFIQMAPADFNKYGFDLLYRVTNQDNKPVAHAKTGMLCFNYTTRKVVSVPLEVRAKLEEAGKG
ncbi:acyl-CoA thioesterase [Adhaeribacter pallidiroseus]|uniref:4-hydroxybenzoyl-CoA thioesterase n=1 Tax=Adhaeribacter pallidiroseus TaxID=2072847 RepID=A0A369QH69_9BACT|nr:thioesterase family protein [Adhaeribacter pallidiroseus]RDC61628.1 4-hydroxybenzoyl-CoA thioesterase [Adhaeribacter pallidiroseus]